MGRWVAIAALVAGFAGAGCSKPAHVSSSASPTCPPPPPPHPAALPPAAADPLAGLEGGAGERMAVVVLMVPGGGDPNVPKQRHEYKLSLAADADSAAVEVDGQPLGAARVQHLAPSALARLGSRAPVVPVRATVAPRARPPAADPLPARSARNRTLPTTMQPAAYVPPPNGAPIID